VLAPLQVEFEAGAALPALEALALRARGAYRGVWPALPRFARLRSLTLAAPVSMDTEGCEAALLVRQRSGLCGRRGSALEQDPPLLERPARRVGPQRGIPYRTPALPWPEQGGCAGCGRPQRPRRAALAQVTAPVRPERARRRCGAAPS